MWKSRPYLLLDLILLLLAYEEWSAKTTQRHISRVAGGLSGEFWTPCVVFAGHPSLRFGDAVQLMEAWRQNFNHALILTDPEFPMAEVLAPFQPLAMKAFYYPIDTRLDFVQVRKVLDDLKPKQLFIPEQYTQPPLLYGARTDLVVKWDSAVEFKSGEVVDLNLSQNEKRLKLDASLSRGLNLASFESSEITAGPLIGYLSTYDNNLQLKAISAPEDGGLSLPVPRLYGTIDSQQLLAQLKKEGLEAAVESQTEKQFSIVFPHCDTSISVTNGVETTVTTGVNTDETTTHRIKNAIMQCLIQL